MNRRHALIALGMAPASGALLAGSGQAAAAPVRQEAASDGVRSIRINGADLAYSLAGEENDHPMILLHGGRGQGTHGSIFASHKVMADQYKVIAFDMRAMDAQA